MGGKNTIFFHISRKKIHPPSCARIGGRSASVFSLFSGISSKHRHHSPPKGGFRQPETGFQTPFFQLYFYDYQVFIKNSKKICIIHIAISKKYYLCHRKNDEDVH
jgi:hypothetical protein